MAGRPIFALISLVFVAGGLLLQFFVVLSGGVSGAPINKFYFIETNNPGGRITGAGSHIAWTFFSVCGWANGVTQNCGKAQAAVTFTPWRNFNVHPIPGSFGSNYYYSVSKALFAFYIVALFFGAIALFTGLLALCTRIGAFLSGAATLIACALQIIAASLMTAEFVMGRDALNKLGFSAHIGKYSFGFTWAAMACYLIAGILFCVAGGSKSSSSTGPKRNKSTRSRDGIKDEYS